MAVVDSPQYETGDIVICDGAYVAKIVSTLSNGSHLVRKRVHSSKKPLVLADDEAEIPSQSKLCLALSNQTSIDQYKVMYGFPDL